MGGIMLRRRPNEAYQPSNALSTEERKPSKVLRLLAITTGPTAKKKGRIVMLISKTKLMLSPSATLSDGRVIILRVTAIAQMASDVNKANKFLMLACDDANQMGPYLVLLR